MRLTVFSMKELMLAPWWTETNQTEPYLDISLNVYPSLCGELAFKCFTIVAEARPSAFAAFVIEENVPTNFLSLKIFIEFERAAIEDSLPQIGQPCPAKVLLFTTDR